MIVTCRFFEHRAKLSPESLIDSLTKVHPQNYDQNSSN